MASRFWTWASNLVAGATARAEQVNAQFSQIDGALLGVANELNRSVRFTAGSVPSEATFQIPQTGAQRANLVMGFDSGGNLQLRAFVFTWRGPWALSTNYAANDAVSAPESHNNSVYIANAAHVSADFAADLAEGKWSVMIDLTQVQRSVKKFKIISSAYEALPGDDLFVDTSIESVVITLPIAPLLSDQPIHVCHIAGDIASRPITMARNGKLIMGLAEDMSVTTDHATFELAYATETTGWRLIKGV